MNPRHWQKNIVLDFFRCLVLIAVVLPQGLIRGALFSLGVSCLVKAEISQFPNCTISPIC